MLNAFVEDMLTHPTLPLDLIDPCMEVMRAMLPSEREFIRIMVEIVIDLRDEDEEENDDVVSLDTHERVFNIDGVFRRYQLLSPMHHNIHFDGNVHSRN